MHQSRRSLGSIPFPQPLRLPIAHFYPLCALHQRPCFLRYSCKHRSPLQLSLTHPCPHQHRPPSEAFSLEDISIRGEWGHYHPGTTIVFDLRSSPQSQTSESGLGFRLRSRFQTNQMSRALSCGQCLCAMIMLLLMCPIRAFMWVVASASTHREYAKINNASGLKPQPT
jgi:hypothetical protein